jgi:CheY-like chemotaxis protein
MPCSLVTTGLQYMGVQSVSARITSILVVDDDTALRETLRDVLEDSGYTVIESQDGLRALEYLRKSPAPMIVLLDLMMPQLDGSALLGAVAGDHRRLQRHRYILMTAGQQTLSLAFVNLLTNLSVPVIKKPFDLDHLLHTIEKQQP